MAILSEAPCDLAEFLTVAQLCDALQLSDRTARELIASGEIRSIRLGRSGRVIRIPKAEISRLTAAANRQEGR